MDQNQSLVLREQWDLPEDYPFKEAFTMQQNRIKHSVRTGQQLAGRRKVTVTVEEEWLPIPFSRIFQNKEVLYDLSHEGAKLLVHMAIHLGFNEHKVKISRTEVGMSKRVFSRGMLELVSKRIIQPVEHKREWYWVNLTILIVGSVDRINGHE